MGQILGTRWLDAARERNLSLHPEFAEYRKRNMRITNSNSHPGRFVLLLQTQPEQLLR